MDTGLQVRRKVLAGSLIFGYAPMLIPCINRACAATTTSIITAIGDVTATGAVTTVGVVVTRGSC